MPWSPPPGICPLTEALHLPALLQMYGPAPCIRGKVAYVPQQAFIINATVRDNILFGLPFDGPHYEQCIAHSCLDTDLRMLAGGDAAELGDKGVNLSGGVEGGRVSFPQGRGFFSSAQLFELLLPASHMRVKCPSLAHQDQRPCDR